MNFCTACVCDKLWQVSYAIGVAEPLSIHVDTYGTAKEGVNDKQILAAVKKVFDFRPGGFFCEWTASVGSSVLCYLA